MIENWHNKPWLRRTVFVGGNLIMAMTVLTFIVWPVQPFFAARDTGITRRAEILARTRAIDLPTAAQSA